MTRLYIAGPMTGMPQFNYPAFNQAQTQLLAAGYEVLNPAAIDLMFPKSCGDVELVAGCKACDERDWKWYMRKSIPMVCQADGVAVLPRWHNSRGARREVDIARDLGMPVEMVETWLRKV